MLTHPLISLSLHGDTSVQQLGGSAKACCYPVGYLGCSCGTQQA